MEEKKFESWEILRLVKLSQSGERDAFGQLVRMYQGRAMNTAVRILGNAEDASEAVQDGFVKAYLDIRELRHAERFGVWLLRIIVNTAVNKLRAAKNRPVMKQTQDELEDCEAKTVEAGRSDGNLEAAIKRAMTQLTDNEAKAVSLFGVKQLSHKEMAQILGCSEAVSRWYLHRGRKKLKALLKEYLV